MVFHSRLLVHCGSRIGKYTRNKLDNLKGVFECYNKLVAIFAKHGIVCQSPSVMAKPIKNLKLSYPMI